MKLDAQDHAQIARACRNRWEGDLPAVPDVTGEELVSLAPAPDGAWRAAVQIWHERGGSRAEYVVRRDVHGVWQVVG